jgi:hypothetical protein
VRRAACVAEGKFFDGELLVAATIHSGNTLDLTNLCIPCELCGETLLHYLSLCGSRT